MLCDPQFTLICVYLRSSAVLVFCVLCDFLRLFVFFGSLREIFLFLPWGCSPLPISRCARFSAGTGYQRYPSNL
jgi:hypothetical protein